MPTPKVHKNVDTSVSTANYAIMPDNVSTSSSRGRGSPEDNTIAADDIDNRRRVRDNKNRNSRVSVSNEDNVLLDPDVLTDFPTQALVLTILVSDSK
jgi:neurofibromin 1